MQNFNSGLLAGTNRPLLSRSSYSLISELDSNGWPKQMAWVSHQNKRVNIADVETGQTHSTLDSRDLITHGVSNALIQYVTKIYDNGNRNINAGVFVSMAMNVVWYPLPRLVTLRFTIDQAYNIAEAKAYKLKINNTTSSAQVILDLANATTVNGNELVITFLDNALMEHTTELQEFEIYKDGQDDSGIPTYNWLMANMQNKLVRKNYQSGNFNYCGYAKFGSAENAAVWTITKITVASNGTVVKQIFNNITWSSVPF